MKTYMHFGCTPVAVAGMAGPFEFLSRCIYLLLKMGIGTSQRVVRLPGG